MAAMMIATAQQPISADVQANGQQIRQLMQEAHDASARLIHFSEGALSGYSKAQIKMFGIQAQGHAACNNYFVSFSVPSNISRQCASRLIGPDGVVIQECPPDQPGIIVNQLDPKALQWQVPLQYARPWRRKARHGEIYQERAPGPDPRSLNKSHF